jgi:hypothetical protein
MDVHVFHSLFDHDMQLLHTEDQLNAHNLLPLMFQVNDVQHDDHWVIQFELDNKNDLEY